MITADQVKAAALATGKQWLVARECSICLSPIGYEIHGEDLYFNGSCDCVRYGSPIEPRSWQSAADWINMQDNETARREVAAVFHLTLP